MRFLLYKVSGYEEAIMSLRMSTGKYYSWEKAQEVQDLVYAVTNKQGFLADRRTYTHNLLSLGVYVISDKGYPYTYTKSHPKITGDYEKDVAEFKRLLGLTMNHAMGEFDHHTLMKYIDVSFFTEGLHRGAQDDLDAHAIAFNNRITRFSSRLAEIDEPKLSEWYMDKLIPLHEVVQMQKDGSLFIPFGTMKEQLPAKDALPDEIVVGNEVFCYTPFGYMLKKFADMSPKNGLRKDVARGGMPLGMASNALWKIDLFNLRYVYHRRSKLTKANPELKEGMEQLADQIEKFVPVFGEYFRMVYTDTGKWEHTNRVRTVTKEEYEKLTLMRQQ